jgi:hypothetical protein
VLNRNRKAYRTALNRIRDHAVPLLRAARRIPCRPITPGSPEKNLIQKKPGVIFLMRFRNVVQPLFCICGAVVTGKRK